MIVFAGNLHGQLVPSELMAAVFPSGQQPKAVLSQEDLSSAVGRVVVATVVPGERETEIIFISSQMSPNLFKGSRSVCKYF